MRFGLPNGNNVKNVASGKGCGYDDKITLHNKVGGGWSSIPAGCRGVHGGGV